MADDVGVIRAEDLFKGIKLQVQYHDPAKPGSTADHRSKDSRSKSVPGAGGSVRTPLEDVCDSLHESWLRSSWAQAAGFSPSPAAPAQLPPTSPPSLFSPGPHPAPGPGPAGASPHASPSIVTGRTGGAQPSSVFPELYTAVLRAVLLEWGPEAPATLEERLRGADALAPLFGLEAGQHEQLLCRALACNEQLGKELQVQKASLQQHQCGLQAADFSSQAAYTAWRHSALAEVQALQELQQRLPAFRGVLEVTVIQAQGLQAPKTGTTGFMCCVKPTFMELNPYVALYLQRPPAASQASAARTSGQAGSGPPPSQSHHAATQVLPGSGPAPLWRTALPHLQLSDPQLDLHLRVRQASEERGLAPGSRDTVLAAGGIRLQGLQSGVTQVMEVPLFSRKQNSSGKSSGAQAGYDDDGEGEEQAGGRRQLSHSSPAGTSGAPGLADNSVVYDPEGDVVLGAGGRAPAGRLALQLRYLADRRRRPEGAAGTVAGESGSPGEGYLTFLFNQLSGGSSSHPLTSTRTAADFMSRFRAASVRLVVQPQELPPCTSLATFNPHSLAKQLAAHLARAHQAGLLPGRSDSPPTHPLAQLPLPSLKPAASGSAGKVLLQHLQSPDVAPFLPLGYGLGILLRFAQLYRIRSETVSLLLVQHQLSCWHQFIAPPPPPPSGPGVEPSGCERPSLGSRPSPSHMSPATGRAQAATNGGRGATSPSATGMGGVEGTAEDYLAAFKACWEPCLTWYNASTLTQDEVDGLKGCMGLFLARALPTLNCHYAVFARHEGVACFMLLLEMVGWAWTWNPDQETPVTMLRDHIRGAATSRLVKNLRPGSQNLAEVMSFLVEEVQAASQDLMRDMDIQAALPGLVGFALSNSRARYTTLTDQLETAFMYQPGSNAGAMQVLWELESAVLEHHRLLKEAGFAVVAPPPGETADGNSCGVEQERASKGRRYQEAPPPNGRPVKRKQEGPPISLWDFEVAFIQALSQWVVSGAVEVAGQVARMVAAESWHPLGSSQAYAASALELERISEAASGPWMECACGGGRRRRAILGGTITRCLSQLLAGFVALLPPVWDKELDTRGRLFLGPAEGTHTAAVRQHRATHSAKGSDPAAPGHTRSQSHGQGPPPPSAALGSLSATPSPRGGKHPTATVPLPPVPGARDGLAMHTAPSESSTRHGSLLSGVGSPCGALGPDQMPLPHDPRHTGSQPTSLSTLGAMEALGAGLPQYLSGAFSASHGAAGTGLLVRSMAVGHREWSLPCLLPYVPPEATAVAVVQAEPAASRQNALGSGHAGKAFDLQSVLDAEPGICMTERMAVLRCSLHKVEEDSRELGSRLHSALVTDPYLSPSHIADYDGYAGPLPDGPLARLGSRGADGSAASPAAGAQPYANGQLRAAVHPHHLGGPALGGQGDWGAQGEGPGGQQVSKEPGGPVQGHWEGRQPRGGAEQGHGSLTPGSLLADCVSSEWELLRLVQLQVAAHFRSTYSLQLRSCLITLLTNAVGQKPEEGTNVKVLGGILTAIHDELRCIQQHLGSQAALAAEAAGCCWRAALSALQLLVLNQAGFRPVREEEADVLRQFLVSLQAMFEDEVPHLTRPNQPRLEFKRIGDPAYPDQLLRGKRMPAHHNAAEANGHSGSPASRTLAASSVGADAAAVRTASTSYASALLQAAMADSADLQDFYSVQLSCLQHARLTPRDAGNVFVELGPQQLPLVDLLRILRQRRKAEASTQAFVTDKLREASAIITQVVFGLVSSERVVSEVRCCLPGPGAVRAGGRLVITQHVACFTTMLDSDLRGTTDTTFTLMRNKVQAVWPGPEPDSLMLSSQEGDCLAFTGFARGDGERVMALLAPRTPAAAAAAAAGTPAASTPQDAPCSPASHASSLAAAQGLGQQQPWAAQQLVSLAKGMGRGGGSAGAEPQVWPPSPTSTISMVNSALASPEAGQPAGMDRQAKRIQQGTRPGLDTPTTSPGDSERGSGGSSSTGGAGSDGRGSQGLGSRGHRKHPPSFDPSSPALPSPTRPPPSQQGGGGISRQAGGAGEAGGGEEQQQGGGNELLLSRASRGAGVLHSRAPQTAAAPSLHPPGVVFKPHAGQPGHSRSRSQGAGLSLPHLAPSPLAQSWGKGLAAAGTAAEQQSGQQEEGWPDEAPTPTLGQASGPGWAKPAGPSTPLAFANGHTSGSNPHTASRGSRHNSDGLAPVALGADVPVLRQGSSLSAPGVATAPGSAADAAALEMSVRCSLVGTLRDTPGELLLYPNRLDFVGMDGTKRCVALRDVESVRQQQALMGATQLAVRVATPASNGAVLLFVGIPDALLASLKQRISDLVTQAD